MSIKTPHSRKNCTCYVLFDVVSNKSGGILMETSPFVHLCLSPPLHVRPVRVCMNSQKSRLCSFRAHNHKSAPGRSGRRFFLCGEVKTRPSASKCEHVARLLTPLQAVNRCENRAVSPLNKGSTNDTIALDQTD